MSLQTRKTFIHFWNTNEDIFDQIWTFWPCRDSNVTTVFKAQKDSMDIIKIVHVTDYCGTTVILWSYKNNLCAQWKNNFFNNFFFSVSVVVLSWTHMKTDMEEKIIGQSRFLFFVKDVRVWNEMRVCNHRQICNFGVNYPFKHQKIIQNTLASARWLTF